MKSITENECTGCMGTESQSFCSTNKNCRRIQRRLAECGVPDITVKWRWVDVVTAAQDVAQHTEVASDDKYLHSLRRTGKSLFRS